MPTACACIIELNMASLIFSYGYACFAGELDAFLYERQVQVAGLLVFFKLIDGF